MRGLLLALILFISLVPGLATAKSPSPPGPHLTTFMTYNVYHGADAEIAAVPTAMNFPDLLTRVAAVYQAYGASNFPERAAIIAVEIGANQPALIALQEVVLVRTGPFLGPPATNVAYDYLQIMLDALAAQGLNYTVVGELPGMDVQLPSALGFDVRHTEREVILARADMPPGHLRLSNVQSTYFATNCQIPTALVGPLTIPRGWLSVDVWSRGRSFRFVNTHLFGDCQGSAVQVAQAEELADFAEGSSLPVVLAGDMNSSPLDNLPSGYGTLADGGFDDAWEIAGVGDGFTCCQDPNLLNPGSLLNTRIDHLLLRGAFDVSSIAVVGADPAKRTPAGLWPSDHAGVTATIRVR